MGNTVAVLLFKYGIMDQTQITELHMEFLHASKRVTVIWNVQDLAIVVWTALVNFGRVAN